MIITEVDYIRHHGVKGQRWGVVKKDKTSGSEKSGKDKIDPKFERRNEKAQKHTDKANEIQKQLDVLNNTPVTWRNRRNITQQKTFLTQKKEVELKAAEAKREGKLTDKQKKVIKGTAIAGGILAAYGTYQLVQSGNANRLITKGKMFATGQKGSPWAMKPSLATKDLTPDAIMASVVKDINPEYGRLGSKMNCRRCTMAYEMRRRGYDVAATRTSSGRGQEEWGLYNALSDKGTNTIPPGRLGLATRVISEQVKKKIGKATDTPFTTDVLSGKFSKGGTDAIEAINGSVTAGIFSSLRKQPEGARGELGITWGMGGGHSVAWEIIKGKAVIFDTQSGKKYENLTDFDKDFSPNVFQTIATAGFTRLDNKPLNNEFLMRWLKDA